MRTDNRLFVAQMKLLKLNKQEEHRLNRQSLSRERATSSNQRKIVFFPRSRIGIDNRLKSGKSTRPGEKGEGGVDETINRSSLLRFLRPGNGFERSNTRTGVLLK